LLDEPLGVKEIQRARDFIAEGLPVVFVAAVCGEAVLLGESDCATA